MKSHLFTAGPKRHLIYGVWATMKQRCSNPSVKCWQIYGGRGIKVCVEWHDFNNFAKDMLPSYSAGLMLGRINNDGDYCKENCRWETRQEQNKNRSISRVITFCGETMNLTDWARKLGLSHSALIRRLKRWPFEKAMTTRKAE